MATKLFISDLHVGDGTAGDDFAYDYELAKLLEEAHEADSNTELIILGDGLELLESKAVRDIGLVNFPTLCDSMDSSILTPIFDKHKLMFDSISKFAKTHKVSYIVGNHDYYILVNDKIREALLERMIFPNFKILPHLYDEASGIFAQHGNQYDVTNSFASAKDGRVIPPMGEYVTRYTMNHFENILRSVKLPEKVIEDYDNVRPVFHVMDWLRYVNIVYKVPVDLVSEWTQSFLLAFKSQEVKDWSRVKFPHTYWLSDLFLKRAGWFAFGRKLVNFGNEFFKLRDTNYLKMKAEKILSANTFPAWKLQGKDFAGYSKVIPDIDYKNLKMVLFGHNHLPGFYVIPTPEGPKYYVNTGTWRPLVEKAFGKGGRTIFHKKVEMNYVIIKEEKKDFIVETRLISRFKVPAR